VLVNDGRILFNGQPDDLLRTQLLAENGIREPLYVTTLRQLGIDVEKTEGLSRLDQLQLADVTFEGRDWSDSDKESQEPLLELEHVSFAYQSGGKPILQDINLKIFKGERIAIVGKNGAGKSTLAKALCQFIETEGSYSWQGQDIKGDSIKERAERIGYVLQNPNQMISAAMIFDEVALGLRLRGLAEAEIEERIHAALKTCGLYEFRSWPISALSFGQKKRVTIASILVLNPEIILLDEPTAGQDQRHYTEMMDFLDELNQQGHTIIMITHDMQLMLDYSDRAVVVVDGQILADKAPAQVLTDQELIAAAHLKETSIFALAEKIGADPLALTEFYMREKEDKHA
jgi:putative ABC transporter ATP-binding protein spr0430